MTTLIDRSARRHLAQSTQTVDLVSMIPVLTHPKADLEFPPNCGRDALNAALALTDIR